MKWRPSLKVMTKKNSKKPQKTEKVFPAKALLFAVLGVLIGLGAAGFALGYYVSGLPEEIFVRRTTVEGFEGQDFEVPFTAFEDLDVAVKTWAEARLLEALELRSERGNVPVTLSALGVSVAWDSVEEELKNYMTSASLFEKTSTYLFGQNVELPVLVDPETLDQTLAQTKIEQGNKNAIFIWENNAVAIQPGQLGYGIEREELLAFLNGSLKASSLPDSLELTLRTSEPEFTEAELTSLLPVAEKLVSRSVTLQDEFGNTWDFALSEHIALVVPAKNEPMASNEWKPWTLDETGFITYLETTLVPEVEEDPSGVVITENADGTYSFEGSARFGKEMIKDRLHADVITALADLNTIDVTEIPLTIPVTTVEPAITVPDSLKAKGVTDLVGLGYSDFGGSPTNRVHNIETGIAQFDGVLIEQGAEFSFMGHMTPVDAEHGFRTELVIKGDETIPEYGGGLCQISSTMFRAALYSGLPITARRNHSYAVSYYARPFGYGLDATVYDPAPDFKFVNDTAGAWLVQAYTEGNSAYYVFYGTNDGRTVSMEGPYSYNYNTVPAQTTFTDKLAPGERELKEYSHTGFTTDWYRTVTYTNTTETVDEDGQPVYLSPYAATVSGVRENIHSVYEARPAKYWEGQAGESEEISEE